MPWGEILKKSWNYIRKYKFLWGLGILAALTEGGASFSNYAGGKWSTDDSQKIGQAADSVSRWTTANIDFIVIALAALFVIGLIILYVSYSARAGLIYSINSLESGGEKLTFSSAFSAGQKYFWRLLGLTLLVALLIFLAVAVFVGLTIGFVALAIVSLWFLIIVIPLGLMLILALVVFCFYLNLLLLIGSRNLVIKNNGVIAAFKAGQKLIRHNFAQILLGWLINLGLNLAAGLALALVVVFVGGALALIGVGVYFAAKWTGVIIYAIPVGLTFCAAMLVISGIINAYFSTFWTLVYKKLT